MATTLKDFHRQSIEQPASGAAKPGALTKQPWQQILNADNLPFRDWFAGGTTNLCHNAVDRHLSDRPDQAALIHVSTETGAEQVFSYRELHAEVNRCAAMLQALGVGKGDRVLIYMPMVPEAIFAMLATVRLGAIHSVVFGGFARSASPPALTTPGPRSSSRQMPACAAAR